MNDLGLFTIEKRVQPIFPDPYIFTVKFSKGFEGFYERLYYKYKYKSLKVCKIKNKKWFKEATFTWQASLESIPLKNIVYSQSNDFSRSMQFKFTSEVDMIDALYTLENYLDGVVTEEFIRYQIAVNAKDEMHL